ncbi:TPA: hypothetical protein N0F65_007281 [Lagenidium giganteum]|uniref:Hexose transporter 1 n=1 Tax=Lagenidium giganteum TaxID=4803 RepID=A0AAV2Z742_9STRA|nr:TPA: hypothetical protein N0F65_007281 [Lagenidium giganteum]
MSAPTPSSAGKRHSIVGASTSRRRQSLPLDPFVDLFADNDPTNGNDHDSDDEEDHDAETIYASSSTQSRETARLLTRRTSATVPAPPVSAALLRFAAASGPVTSAPTIPQPTEPQSSSPSSPPPLVGSYLLYTSVLITVLSGPQLGWEIAQLNLGIFHNDKACAERPVLDGTCIVFPGHTKTEWVLAVMCWVLGAAVGALVTNIPADRYGRRFVVMLNSCLMTVGALFQTLAPNIGVFALGRFISGLASGSGTAITSVYLGEIGPAHQRAAFVVAFQGAGSLGLVAVTLAHFAISGSPTSWRWIMCVPIVIGCLQLLMSPFLLIESPKWLVTQQRHKDAASAFHLLYKRGSFQELEQIVKNEQDRSRRRRESLLAATTAMAERRASLNTASGASTAAGVAKNSFWTDALSPRYKRQLIISCILCTARQFGGVAAVFYYSSGIFARAGIEDSRVGNLVLATFNTLAVLAICVFMKRVRRRAALLIGITGMIFSSIGMTFALVYKHPISIAFTAMYVCCNSFSLNPLPFLITAEVLPEHLKSKGVSITTFINWFCNLVVGFGFPVLAAALGNYTFIPFTCLLVVFWVCVYAMLPETKNKTNEEIQQDFADQAAFLSSFKKTNYKQLYQEDEPSSAAASGADSDGLYDLELGEPGPLPTQAIATSAAARRASRRASMELMRQNIGPNVSRTA